VSQKHHCATGLNAMDLTEQGKPIRVGLKERPP
jgi:hypothetical protein